MSSNRAMPFSGQALQRTAWLVIAVALAVALFLLSSDARTRLLAYNSLKLAAGTAVIALPAGTLLAFLLVRTDVRCRSAALLLLAGLLVLPLYLQALAWDAGFGTHGWYSLARSARSPMTAMKTMTTTAADLRAWLAAIGIHGVAAVPWVVLIVGSGLRFVEPELEEQALLDASAGRVVLRVILPRTLSSVGAAALWVIVTTCGEMTVTDLFQVRTYAEEIYTGFASGESLQEATVQALPAVSMLVCLVVSAWILFATVTPGPAALVRRSPPMFRLGSWRWIGTAGAWMLIGGPIGILLGNLVYRAGITVPQDGPRQWSLGRLVEVLRRTPSVFGEDFYWTALICGGAATIGVLTCVPAVWWARRSRVGAAAVTFVAVFCLAVPGPLVGLWIIWAFNSPGWSLTFWLYDKTIVAPVFAALVRSLPVAIFIIWQGLRTVSSDVLDAAATAGAGPIRRLWHIALRSKRRAIGAAWLAAFAAAAADLSATNLVLPPRVTTLSYRTFSLIHQGVLNQEAGLGLLSLFAFWTLAFAFGALVRKS